jgi:hypothetical protein
MTELLVQEEVLFNGEEDGHYGFGSEMSESDEQKESNERSMLKATVRKSFVDQINSCGENCRSVHIDSVIEELDILMSQSQIRFLEFEKLQFCSLLQFLII